MRTLLGRHPVLVYSLARVALFAGACAVLSIVGLRSVALVVAALIVSGLLSIWLLSGPRDVMSAAVATRLDRIRTGIDGSAASEDEDDEVYGEQPGASGATRG